MAYQAELLAVLPDSFRPGLTAAHGAAVGIDRPGSRFIRGDPFTKHR
jgi:hypothetical protein